jgi:epoxyqueuosine reductase
LTSDLTERLRDISSQNCGDLFGVSDLTPARDFIIAQGGKALGEYPRAISIGMQLIDSIIDLYFPDEKRELSLYWHQVYAVMVPLLDFLSYKVSRELQKEGYRAFPVPASPPYNSETWKGVFSHKLAAHLAGLGWIGKSCLLITPDFGPRIRFTTILTDAPLTPGYPIDKQCGKCRVCVTSCPVKAFKDREFEPEEPVEMRFNVQACGEFRRLHPCGVCVASCPRGQNRKKSLPP